MTMTYGEKMALKTPVSREEAERVLAKEGIGCGAVMALRFARTLLATMTELEQVKGAEREAVMQSLASLGQAQEAYEAQKAAETALAAMTEREGVLRSACAPFKDMAGEMFARNWNRDQVAIALDNPGDPHRLMFGDFLDLHAALQHKDDTHGPE